MPKSLQTERIAKVRVYKPIMNGELLVYIMSEQWVSVGKQDILNADKEIRAYCDTQKAKGMVCLVEKDSGLVEKSSG